MYSYDYETDRYRDYRRDEIHPDVYDLMERVRLDHHKEVPYYAIDKAIKLQEERSVVTACNFIRYFLLYELSYVDVFGSAAVEYDQALAHYKQCENMEIKIDNLARTIGDLKEQLSDTQEVIIRMANQINRQTLRKVI